MALETSALTPKQQEVIAFWQAYNVPGEWTADAPDSDGVVEARMQGDGFEWQFIIEPDGETETAERETGGEWSTGIEI